MKIRNLFFGVLTAMTVVVAFSSCNDDDDNTYWVRASSSQRATAYANFTKNGSAGTSRLYYWKDGASRPDTLATPVNWRFTNDSTVVFGSVPDSVFASYFTYDDELRNAIKGASPSAVTITANINYLSYDGSVYAFINPTASVLTMDYLNQQQTFQPMFLFNTIYLTLDNDHLAFSMAFAGYKLNSGSDPVRTTSTLNMYFRAQ